jgi:hypothetical protein
VSSGNKAKGVAAGVGLLGTVVSIWWFALRPRRKRRKAAAGDA